jgi:hypothetical protein
MPVREGPSEPAPYPAEKSRGEITLRRPLPRIILVAGLLLIAIAIGTVLLVMNGKSPNEVSNTSRKAPETTGSVGPGPGPHLPPEKPVFR